LLIRPCTGAEFPDWRTRGVQPDIGHQLARVGEPGEVTDGGDNRDRRDRVHARDGHQPGHHRIGERLDGQLLVGDGQLLAVEVQLPQQRLHGRVLVGGQGLAGQPVPPGGTEQVRNRRSGGQVPGQDGMNLVLDLGPLPDQVRPPGHLAAQPAGPFIRQPYRRQEVSGQQLRQDARIDLVRLNLSLGDRPGLGRIRHHHPACQRNQQVRDRIAVPGRL
jgi:hypothetical protein